MAAKKIAGVLGATGSVGQRFILLLADHPDFELRVLGASHRSAGKKYIDAVNWKQTDLLPEFATDIVVSECKADQFSECDIVFSGLDADYAGAIEKEFVEAGLAVVSNAKNYRRESDVPLVVPIVNPEHLDLISAKIEKSGKRGFIVCISNCSTAGLVAPLKPLVEKFGPIDALTTTTLQVISLRFKNRPAPALEDVKQCLREYVCDAYKLGCHSAPKQTIHLLEQNDRPQPRLDRNRDAGYGVSVGRVREDPVLDFKMVVLSHNTVIGAAGAGILIAEILLAKKLI